MPKKKITSRKISQHFLHAIVFMFLLLILSNHMVFSFNLESVCTCEFQVELKTAVPYLTLPYAGLLVGRGKKVKFRGIFRVKFAQKKHTNFAGISREYFEASSG